MPSSRNATKLPKLLHRKIYKTGQTRGADDDVIYQNRVLRNSTALFPFSVWDNALAADDSLSFENGYIVLIPPKLYFDWSEPNTKLRAMGLTLGENALLFYDTREDWDSLNPESRNLSVAVHRKAPLGGSFVARIAATTGSEGARINKGFTTTNNKGAGIRGYEYASKETLTLCRYQLESLYWMCQDADEVSRNLGMSAEDINILKRRSNLQSLRNHLLDLDRLFSLRIINAEHHTICPLCLEPLSAMGFVNRLTQAEGREVHDLTVTEINLFHLEEVKYGQFNHKTYNLGWGHHHCNVVTKDSGIQKTIEWMESVIARNAAFSS